MTIPMDRIEVNPRVCNGKPVIKGTRMPVSVILDQIAEAEYWDAILAGYPERKISRQLCIMPGHHLTTQKSEQPTPEPLLSFTL